MEIHETQQMLDISNSAELKEINVDPIVNCATPTLKPKKKLPQIPRKWMIFVSIILIMGTIVCLYFATLLYLDNAISLQIGDSPTRHVLGRGDVNGSVTYMQQLSNDDDTTEIVKVIQMTRTITYRDNSGNNSEIYLNGIIIQFKNSKAAKNHADTYTSPIEDNAKRDIYVVSKFLFDIPKYQYQNTDENTNSYINDIISQMTLPSSINCFFYNLLTFNFDDIGGDE